MEDATKELLNYKALGAIVIILLCGIIALARYIGKIHKEHTQQMAEIAKEGHAAIRGNTDVLSALKTLLETQRKR